MTALLTTQPAVRAAAANEAIRQRDAWDSIVAAVAETSWMSRGLCQTVDPELFFPPTGEQGKEMVRDARTVCARCDVLAECLEYAVADPDIYGIWAGTTDQERRRMRRERQQPARGTRRPSVRCRKGHLRTPENTGRHPKGGVRCLDCQRESEQRQNRKRNKGVGSGNWKRTRSSEGPWAA